MVPLALYVLCIIYSALLCGCLQQIGLLSAVPFIAMWVTQLGTGLTADLIKFKHKKASLTLIRKVCVVGGKSPRF